MIPSSNDFNTDCFIDDYGSRKLHGDEQDGQAAPITGADDIPHFDDVAAEWADEMDAADAAQAAVRERWLSLKKKILTKTTECPEMGDDEFEIFVQKPCDKWFASISMHKSDRLNELNKQFNRLQSVVDNCNGVSVRCKDSELVMMNYFAKRIVNVEFNKVCSSLEATMPRLREFMVEKLRHGQHATWSDRAKGVRDLVSGAINIEMDKVCKQVENMDTTLEKTEKNWRDFKERGCKLESADYVERRRREKIMRGVKDQLVVELGGFMVRQFGAEKDWLLLKRIVNSSMEPFFREIRNELDQELSTTYVKLSGADHLRLLQENINAGNVEDRLVKPLVFRYIEEKNGFSKEQEAANRLLAKAIFKGGKKLHEVI